MRKPSRSCKEMSTHRYRAEPRSCPLAEKRSPGRLQGAGADACLTTLRGDSTMTVHERSVSWSGPRLSFHERTSSFRSSWAIGGRIPVPAWEKAAFTSPRRAVIWPSEISSGPGPAIPPLTSCTLPISRPTTTATVSFKRRVSELRTRILWSKESPETRLTTSRTTRGSTPSSSMFRGRRTNWLASSPSCEYETGIGLSPSTVIAAEEKIRLSATKKPETDRLSATPWGFPQNWAGAWMIGFMSKSHGCRPSSSLPGLVAFINRSIVIIHPLCMFHRLRIPASCIFHRLAVLVNL